MNTRTAVSQQSGSADKTTQLEVSSNDIEVVSRKRFKLVLCFRRSQKSHNQATGYSSPTRDCTESLSSDCSVVERCNGQNRGRKAITAVLRLFMRLSVRNSSSFVRGLSRRHQEKEETQELGSLDSMFMDDCTSLGTISTKGDDEQDDSVCVKNDWYKKQLGKEFWATTMVAFFAWFRAFYVLLNSWVDNFLLLLKDECSFKAITQGKPFNARTHDKKDCPSPEESYFYSEL